MRDGIITIPGSNLYYDKHSAWGVYTKNQDDALALAMGLGTVHPKIDSESGIYPHYHMVNDDGVKGFGKYKHFHIWYGRIIP